MRKKTKNAITVIAGTCAALAAGGILLYTQIFHKAQHTIELLRTMAFEQSWDLHASCSVLLEPSDENQLLSLAAQTIFDSEGLPVHAEAEGICVQGDLDLDLFAGMNETTRQITTICLKDGISYVEIGSLAELLAGDALESNLVLRLAYEGWIRDHYITGEQLQKLVAELTGVTWSLQELQVAWTDVLLFFMNPNQLLDPKLWSSVQITQGDDYSTYCINGAYFAELAGLEADQMDAQLSFRVFQGEREADMRLALSFIDDMGNKITADVTIEAEQMENIQGIEAPQLLITGEQVDMLGDWIGSVFGKGE